MSRKLKIAQFALGAPRGALVGGAEEFAANLARRLNPARFEVALLGVWQFDDANEREQAAALRDAGVHFLTLMPHHVDIRRLRYAIQPMRRFLRGWKPDVVNTHAEYADFVMLAANALCLPRVAHIRTAHLADEFPVVGAYRPRLARLLSAALAPLRREDVGITRAVTARLDARPMARALRRKSHLIYNGVDLENIRAKQNGGDIRAELGVPGGAQLAGMVGRFEARKGHPDFLRAAQQVAAENPNAFFVVVGDGPERASQEAQARGLGLGGRVFFTGARSDAIAIICQLNALVSASTLEGLPTVLLEAMTVGTPIVATAIDGNTELAQEGVTGRLARPRDPASLASAISRSLGDPSASARMAQAAQQRAQAFSLDAIARQYEQLYERVTNHG